jgi:DnaA family protein
VTRQLALPLQPPPAPTLDNFVPGRNGELVARLRALQAGRSTEAVLYLWGGAGSGRSHLLRACARDGVRIADDVERLEEPAQVELFHEINRAREAGGTVLAAGALPPARLELREDLRSRLAWGLVYEVLPLSDEERAFYLLGEAARRGMRLTDDVADYLLTRVRRDMASLGAILDHLDRVSLERRRAVTLPLVREVLRAPPP